MLQKPGRVSEINRDVFWNQIPAVIFMESINQFWKASIEDFPKESLKKIMEYSQEQFLPQNWSLLDAVA